MHPVHKFAKIERERRFLLHDFPKKARVVRIYRITDRYVDGTTLRLRKQTEDNGPTAYKLTQKIPVRDTGSQQGLIATMYLTEKEHAVLARLPAHELSKTRHSVPPFGIDVFDGALEGLILAEAEFDSADAADALVLPPFISREVTNDDRLTGGHLARASRQEVEAALREYGINFASP
jgi:CYTH domain-containing protein